MSLNRAWIERHIPHQGRMCLLDEVTAWDSQRIICLSGSHRAADHPLRSHGRLGAACGIEYAAQAMALHGALAGDAGRPKAGFLASVREVRLHVLRLDDIDSDLICEADHMASNGITALYGFSLRSEARILLDGRAAVVFDVERLQP